MTISTGNVLAMFAFAVWGLWGSRILYWLTSAGDYEDFDPFCDEATAFVIISFFFLLIMAALA